MGRNHVVPAWGPDIERRAFGGLRYPDPGDPVEAFSRRQSLTVALEDGEGRGDYTLRADGCAADYHLTAGDDAAF